jgi:hypothetical protein
LAGSIPRVLPASFLSPDTATSITGGLAAAIAVGAFIGQALAVVASATDAERREAIALGGFIGLLAMIGLILLSAELG